MLPSSPTPRPINCTVPCTYSLYGFTIKVHQWRFLPTIFWFHSTVILYRYHIRQCFCTMTEISWLSLGFCHLAPWCLMGKIAPQTIGKCSNLWKITRLTIEKWPGFYKIKEQRTQIVAIRQKHLNMNHTQVWQSERRLITWQWGCWQLGGRFDDSSVNARHPDFPQSCRTDISVHLSLAQEVKISCGSPEQETST